MYVQCLSKSDYWMSRYGKNQILGSCYDVMRHYVMFPQEFSLNSRIFFGGHLETYRNFLAIEILGSNFFPDGKMAPLLKGSNCSFQQREKLIQRQIV